MAVFVPGVGDDSNLRDDWLVWAHNLYAAAESTAVLLWKGYDDPADIADAALAELRCDDRAECGGRALSEFVADLVSLEAQTLTLVAHSFGSLVVGAALADHDLRCTNVVVVGSPGMNVEGVRDLHLRRRQFYVERAPGDPVADLGLLGPDPASGLFGGNWLATNDEGLAQVRGHSQYFEPGSAALANIVDVVTGRTAQVVRHRLSVGDVAGGVVVGSLTLPLRPLEALTRHYRGPGFRVLVNLAHAVHLGANEMGNLVRDTLDQVEDWAFGTRPGPGPSGAAMSDAGTRAPR